MKRTKPSLGAMTLDEKIGQLTMLAAGFATTGPTLSPDYTEAVRAGRAGSLLNLWGIEATRAMQRIALEETRLGIPLLLGFDVVHGHRTIFPIPLGEAATFDPHLWERTARVAACEAAEDGVALTFAPMLDVTRDPRWGRMAESPGEDSWVACRFAEAKVRGFQGDSLAAATSLAATSKHIGAYGAVTAGREYGSVDISERTLRETYLPPFRAAVAAGTAAVMPSFNDLAGIPVTAHRELLRGRMRDGWGFGGVVISDYNAISELMLHGVAGDIAEAAALALKAGVDIDMMGDAYARGLPTALKRGAVTMADIDAAVARVFALKEALGLFEDPYRRGFAPVDGAARRALAREAARRSLVLLTNRGGVLPLAEAARRIAVIGPLADAAGDMIGPWSGAGEGDEAVSPYAGLRAALTDRRIAHAAGADKAGIDEAVRVAGEADLVVLCVGEGALISGEGASRARPGLPGDQRHLAERILDLGKPVVAVLFSGRPLIVPWLIERAAATVAAWFPGSEAGHAIADVLCGKWSPSGRLPVSWPVDVGQVPIFYAQRPTGRPADPDNRYSSRYIDMPVAPMFPFGHGLTYAAFAYANATVTPSEVRPGDELWVSIDVTNAGSVAGEETVFLFARDPVASVARPLLELKGVRKVTIPPGGRARVEFTLPATAFAFLGPDLRETMEPGIIELFVGPSAEAARLLKASLTLLPSSA